MDTVKIKYSDDPKLYMRNYMNDRYAKTKEYIQCPCGKNTVKKNYKDHLKTKYHLLYESMKNH